MKTSDLLNFVNTFYDEISGSNKKLYQTLIESSGIKSFDDYEEFYFAVLYPFENFIDGFVRCRISENEEVSFLIKHSRFVERYFCKMIEKIEGSTCCADKSRTIMKSLIDFYKTGRIIKFNYNEEYTFHLPKTIFKEHNDIVEFYSAIKNLFYGNAQGYIDIVEKYEVK